MSDPVRGAAVRVAATRAIAAVRFEGASLKATLPSALAGFDDSRDRALCEAICFEACRWTLRYEALLGLLMPRPLQRSLRIIHALLLAGLAQLDAMQLAEYAAISSTAEAARGLRQPRYVGLVNAVLRRYVRERDALHAALANHPIAVHAHPLWLAQTLHRDWGEASAAILTENNRAAPVWLRVNQAQITRDTYRATLAAAALQPQTCDYAPDALRLEQGVIATRLPGWDGGQVSVQDLSAQLTVEALAAQRGERVLDACAAPGGKSAHVLERTSGLAQLIAMDIDEQRLTRVRESLDRLRLRATLRSGDAATPTAWWDGRAFDRILIDAPCSGTGVIRRQPDIKLHRRAADLPAMTALQARLLDALWPLLRTGGRLVYATCSVLKDENEHQIDAFLARTPDAHPVALPDHFGRVSGAGRQRFPGEDGGDGFFHAALEKIV